ncbi:flagellar basal body-associated protein FliL [Actibacterium sp. 188UL27-1]|uniref:flagellar basal body-associated FliL family protein n=1 Tax=Actibacterium sp. 188UL27-1 TaxID=2786961 RepID=UPI00195C9CB2|nr:flagellar basal body-associated FliL family protein [Actibacterium sp. 188UL27-1]MBM7066221.1 flagellar basal body-associated FliL family protein [Actibacterium sp. 188UL27-1]
MSDASEAEAEAPPKKSKLPPLIGLVLAVALGGGGFYATYSGLIGGTGDKGEDVAHEKPAAALPSVAFVPIDPLIISLNEAGHTSHLRFRGHLEVVDGQSDEVATLMPRVSDVLNGYLRALSTQELEDPTSLLRLRAQMLRRVQLVVGDGRVRDLLITEFVIN